MNKFILFIVFFLCHVAFADTFYVAILGTVFDGKEDPLSPGERRLITDEIIKEAKARVRNKDIQVMDRESISQMLPPGKGLADCEGDCLVETGRKISADMIFQATMSKVSDGICLRGELRSVSDNYATIFNYIGRNRDDITQNARDSVRKIFDGMLVKMGFSQAGISDLTMGGYEDNDEFTLEVRSEPSGAWFSLDSVTMPDCNMTPCTIKVQGGAHLLRLHTPKYFDLDTSILVDKKEITLQARLKPNFGKLVLNPRLVDSVGSYDDFEFYVDGKLQDGNTIELVPGRHKVKITNRCYNPAEFVVTMSRDTMVNFNSTMRPLQGRLNMTANKDGRDVRIPVFVAAEKQPSFTPFNREVPVCAEILASRNRERIDVEIKENEVVSYEYSYSGMFAPLASDFLDTRDSSRYPAISVGNQDWFVRNLGYKYKKESWCYSGDAANCEKYGRLYTWDAAEKACPVGWKLPTASDVDSLFIFIGDKSYAGNSLKSCDGWESNGNGSDDFGFSALPAGYRIQNGRYYGKGMSAYFWLADEVDKKKAKKMVLDNLAGASIAEDYKDAAYSVRCIRDKNYIDVDTLCRSYTWRSKAGCLLDYNVAMKASASKTLEPQSGNVYNVENILKSDTGVWAAPFRKSVRFDLYAKPGATLYGLAILNGYRKNSESYLDNHRIRKAKIYAGKKYLQMVEIEDMNESYDIVKFDRPLVGVEKISVEILDVHRGEKWNDVCVTHAILIGKVLPSAD